MLKILRLDALPYALPAAGDRQPLEQFVQDYIVAGSLAASDKWWAYDELELLGYAHESWNHSKGCFAGTNQGENIWSVTKRHARKAVRWKNPDETARLSLPRMDGKSQPARTVRQPNSIPAVYYDFTG